MLLDYLVVPQRDSVLLQRQFDCSQDLMLTMSM
jgi:hypothetical protein